MSGVLTESLGGQSSLDGLSYYRATANDGPEHGPLRGDHDCDVCIIGAGYTGLSAAIELAKAGRKVIVLEAGPVGWGASGRNGGQICTGYSPGMDKFEAALSDDEARMCFAVAEEGKQLIRDRMRAYNIDCDLTWGYLHVAHKTSQMDELRSFAADLAGRGCEGLELLHKDRLAEKLASTVYQGGLREAGAGHLHPLNYCLGLAAGAVREGAQIFERSVVQRVEHGATAKVITGGGRVTAGTVIVACNGYVDGLMDGLANRVMPVGSYVIASEPLGEARARALIRDNEAVADCNFVVDYYRLSRDRRMLFGGRCSYSGNHPRDLAANMRPRMLAVFPQLGDVKIDYAWGGYIAITYNRLPDAGRLGSNIYYAHGFSGQGVALAGMFGKLMAEAVMGDTGRFDVFGKIRHAPFPGGPLRRPALTLGMLYYRLRDLLA